MLYLMYTPLWVWLGRAVCPVYSVLYEVALELSTGMHAHHPSTEKLQAGGLNVQSYPGPHNEVSSIKREKKNLSRLLILPNKQTALLTLHFLCLYQ